MKNWQDILPLNAASTIVGASNPRIRHLQTKASLVEEGDVFIAQKGLARNGHNFIPEAITRGASVVVCEREYRENIELKTTGLTYCIVPDTREFAGLLFRNYYPELQEITLIGITGTNGKTTIATLLYQAFKNLGYKVGLLSTIRVMIDEMEVQATHTTPDIASLYSLLAQMYLAGCRYVFMECSSHAISQKRIAGLDFRCAVFTNLTHDHLDYHGSFKEYIEAKKLFFDHLLPSAVALSNIDDKYGNYILQNTSACRKTYALQQMADFQAKVLINNFDGLTLEYYARGGVNALSSPLSVSTQLIGEFNAYNLLAVYGVCELLLKLEPMQIWATISQLKGAEGRLELHRYTSPVDFCGIIDYAHTPDSLEQTLKTLKAIRTRGEIIVVFGCGGNRDRLKRPLMTKVAISYADKVFLTADNPRDEQVAQILADMLEGISEEGRAKIQVYEQRREALRYAVKSLANGDILLIAGKGHEKYQEIAGKKYPFDDRQVLDELSQNVFYE